MDHFASDLPFHSDLFIPDTSYPSFLLLMLTLILTLFCFTVCQSVKKKFPACYVFRARRGISYILSVCHTDQKYSHLLVPPYPVIVDCKNIISSLGCLWQSGQSQPCFLICFFLSRFWSVTDQSHNDSCLWDSNGPTPASTTESLQGVY